MRRKLKIGLREFPESAVAARIRFRIFEFAKIGEIRVKFFLSATSASSC
jgi:hypothetical protein